MTEFCKRYIQQNKEYAEMARRLGDEEQAKRFEALSERMIEIDERFQ